MLDKILTIACEICQVEKEKISGKDRMKKIVITRQLYCYIAREHFRYNLTEIANSINKDHTTVIHSYRNVKNMLDVDDELWSIPYKKIMEKIREESKSEIKLHIILHDMTNPALIINELLAKYDCSINVIY